jgi:ribosome recycling factor
MDGALMDVNDLKGCSRSQQADEAALDHVQHEFGGVRTGRASVTILDGVHVDAYGSKMPLNQVAGLSIPSRR